MARLKPRTDGHSPAHRGASRPGLALRASRKSPPGPGDVKQPLRPRPLRATVQFQVRGGVIKYMWSGTRAKWRPIPSDAWLEEAVPKDLRSRLLAQKRRARLAKHTSNDNRINDHSSNSDSSSDNDSSNSDSDSNNSDDRLASTKSLPLLDGGTCTSHKGHGTMCTKKAHDYQPKCGRYATNPKTTRRRPSKNPAVTRVDKARPPSKTTSSKSSK